jgi:hypothetical protein
MDMFNPLTWVKVAADGVGHAVKTVGQVQSTIIGAIAGEEAKHHVEKVYNEIGNNIRRNPITDGIDHINEQIGLRDKQHPLTKEIIYHIDTSHDDMHSSIDSTQFKERCNLNENCYNAFLATIPYTFFDNQLNMEQFNKDKFKDVIKSKTNYIDNQYIDQFIHEYSLIKMTQNYIIAKHNFKNELLICFRGTIPSNTQDLKDDICVGNLTGGYHYTMLNNCVYYLLEDDEYMLKQIQSVDFVKTSSHSLGAGISIYLLIVCKYFQSKSNKLKNDLDIQINAFGCPIVLPRVFRNKYSKYIVSIIDENDPVTKYYKNNFVCHPTQLLHICALSLGYLHISQFNVDIKRFEPNLINQINKMINDGFAIDNHYMESYYKTLVHHFKNNTFISL